MPADLEDLQEKSFQDLHNTELPEEVFFREFYKFYFEGSNVQSGIHIIPVSSTGFCFEDFLGETTATDAEIPAEAAEEVTGLRANSIGFLLNESKSDFAKVECWCFGFVCQT